MLRVNFERMGRELMHERRRRKHTQVDAAKHLGISSSAVDYFEAGGHKRGPSAEVYVRTCVYLRRPLDHFVEVNW